MHEKCFDQWNEPISGNYGEVMDETEDWEIKFTPFISVRRKNTKQNNIFLKINI